MSEEKEDEWKWEWEFREERLLIGRSNRGDVRAIDMALVTSVSDYRGGLFLAEDGNNVWVTANKDSHQLHDIPVETVLEYWATAKANYA